MLGPDERDPLCREAYQTSSVSRVRSGELDQDLLDAVHELVLQRLT
jgi:hypothetical protein